MKKTTKAVLLSALLFPGAGHLFLKKYIFGLALIIAGATALYVLVSNVVEKALEIVDQAQRGEVPPDITIITELVLKQAAESDVQALNIATATLIVAWLVGIVGSYLVGRVQDKAVS
jgi:hypothetical protein